MMRTLGVLCAFLGAAIVACSSSDTRASGEANGPGAMGTQPNDQQKMMSTIMPVMMTVMFSSFASGLNLYYTVQNLVSIPQQWMLLQERKKRGLVAAVQAKTMVPSKK